MTRDSVDKILSSQFTKILVRTTIKKYICIKNWGNLVLQIGAVLFYYKLGQKLLQIGTASLLKISASVITNGAAARKKGNFY